MLIVHKVSFIQINVSETKEVIIFYSGYTHLIQQQCAMKNAVGKCIFVLFLSFHLQILWDRKTFCIFIRYTFISYKFMSYKLIGYKVISL